MRGTAPAGRRIEIVFSDADVAVEIEHAEDDGSMAQALLDALELDDPDEAEEALRMHLSDETSISRRG